MPSRTMPHPERLADTSAIVALAECEPEYDVLIVSRRPPRSPPLNVGRVDPNGDWRPYEGAYYLEISCRVRNSPVRLCSLNVANDTGDAGPSLFDEDCGEDDLDGFFIHPESPTAIRIPNAGCGQFWIEFAYGKWLYPRLHNDRLALLNEEVRSLATATFGTAFIEACSWH